MTLTDTGFATVVEAAPVNVELVRSLVLDVLDADQVRQLDVIGRRMLRRVDPDATYPPRGTRARP